MSNSDWINQQERNLEVAMSAWERDHGNLKRTEAAVSGLFLALDALLLGTPSRIRDARSRGNDAVIRVAYHEARGLIVTLRPVLSGQDKRPQEPNFNAKLNQLKILVHTIQKAAGL